MKKVALLVILLTVIALPCCKWGKKEEVVTTTTTEVRRTQVPVVEMADMPKELAEEAGYDEADGYDNERMAA